jgi:DUF4097 and DUF4098 domain-containing protein YvlB
MPFRALALLAPLALAGCVVDVDSEGQIVRDERRFEVSGVPELRLATFDGSIEIQSWDKPDVLVAIEKRGPTREAVDSLQIETTQDARRISLEVKQPGRESFRGFGLHRSASARLIVSVPQRCDMTARTGDGSIRIDRVTGRIELRTGDGSIRASHVSGDLKMHTGDGSINVDGAEGTLDVDTGDGGVSVAGRLSEVRMHTGDGSIAYNAEPGSSMADDWTIATGDGTVTLYLPDGFNAEIDAHTGDGSVSNELKLASASGDDDRRTVKGRLGSGGRLIRIRTGDGSIRLRAN